MTLAFELEFLGRVVTTIAGSRQMRALLFPLCGHASSLC
jgi:hypothetical protein